MLKLIDLFDLLLSSWMYSNQLVFKILKRFDDNTCLWLCFILYVFVLCFSFHMIRICKLNSVFWSFYYKMVVFHTCMWFDLLFGIAFVRKFIIIYEICFAKEAKLGSEQGTHLFNLISYHVVIDTSSFAFAGAMLLFL